MNDASWWDRKLGRAPQPQQQYQPSPGPQGPVGTPYVPAWPGANGNGQNGEPPPIWVLGSDGQKRLNVTAWQGGKGTKTETGRCPQCGGTNYFSRTNSEGGGRAGIMNQHGQHCAPAPQCADCSYNGNFMIFGGG